MGLAQNEMKAKPALPERVRSMEGLGVAALGRKCLHTHFVEEFFANDLAVLDVVQANFIHHHSVATRLVRYVVSKPNNKLVVMWPRSRY